MRVFRYGLIAVLLLATTLSLFISGCKPQGLVSTSQEIKIGKQASEEVERQNPVDNDPQLNAMVNRIGQTLVGHSDRQDIKYTFKVLDVKDVNAFSLPGGWVYVNKGLIDATRGRNDELAGVIAHEIGHIVARHSAAAIGRELQAAILIGTLTKGQTQQIASVFADVSQLHYSREQEYEADKLGIAEMLHSNQEDPQVFEPQGLIDFFGSLLKIEKKPPSGFEQIFRTHPVTANRIKAAQAYLDDLRAGKANP
jgi:predicted Zn-dependent protease